MNSDWPGLFVSSTCHDLIDLRAELEVHLKDLGFDPVMSDRATSSFDVPADKNSIEACLANVRKCPLFICVLSQRYGPPLADYGNLSATHVEYRAAKEAKIPIRMYVRDRLEAEHAIWKANLDSPTVQYRWVANKDRGLFQLLDQHKQLLAEAPTSNWTWPFTDSVQLKAILASDLKAESRRVLLRRLLSRADVPSMSLTAVGGSGSNATLHGRNLGGAPAYGVEVRSPPEAWKHIGDFGPNESPVQISIRLPSTPAIHVRYHLGTGELVEQRFIWDCRPPAILRVLRKETLLVADED